MRIALRVFKVIGMKAKYKNIIAITSITIMILLIVSIFVLLEYFKYSLFNPHVYKVCSDKSGSHHVIIFNQGALQGYELQFGIVDESKNEPNLIIIGPVDYTDTSFHLMQIVISADQSIVATESYYGFDGEEISYWLAYDFTNLFSYGSGRSRDQNQSLIKARNKAIQNLMISRGGVKPLISDAIGFSFFNKDNKLSWLAWRRWQKQVDKAKEKSKSWTPPDANTFSN